MKFWFTSDTHFSHASIINLCKRPFSSVQEMDQAMISNWNAFVSPGDVIWHLGDFAFRSTSDRMAWIFHRLNGEKRLITGNHDHEDALALPWAAPPQQMADIRVEGIRIVLCHYGLRVWPGMRKGAIHLYGHSHGRLPGTSLSLDVGVDCWGFRPVGLDQIRERLAKLPAVDPERDPGGV